MARGLRFSLTASAGYSIGPEPGARRSSPRDEFLPVIGQRRELREEAYRVGRSEFPDSLSHHQNIDQTAEIG
jgi:hypothetical protein